MICTLKDKKYLPYLGLSECYYLLTIFHILGGKISLMIRTNSIIIHFTSLVKYNYYFCLGRSSFEQSSRFILLCSNQPPLSQRICLNPKGLVSL